MKISIWIKCFIICKPSARKISSGIVILPSLSFKSKAILASSTGSLSFKIASTLSFGESSDLSTLTSNRIVFPAYL
ncbi:hypothetical protein OAQ30_02215 [Nitrosopumilus sp.]|nr:hypothetical protein [Nitrosopumilus sp.]